MKINCNDNNNDNKTLIEAERGRKAIKATQNNQRVQVQIDLNAISRKQTANARIMYLECKQPSERANERARKNFLQWYIYMGCEMWKLICSNATCCSEHIYTHTYIFILASTKSSSLKFVFSICILFLFYFSRTRFSCIWTQNRHTTRQSSSCDTLLPCMLSIVHKLCFFFIFLWATELQCILLVAASVVSVSIHYMLHQFKLRSVCFYFARSFHLAFSLLFKRWDYPTHSHTHFVSTELEGCV